MSFLYFNCKRSNLDQILSIKIKTGSIEDKSLKMTLGPYGVNTKDMVLNLNKLFESVPEGLEVFVSVYLFKDLSFILIPKGVSITSLFFLVYSYLNCQRKHEGSSLLPPIDNRKNFIFDFKKLDLKALVITLKIKIFLEKILLKAISDILKGQKGIEIIDLTRDSFDLKDLKSLLGTLKSFNLDQ